MSRLFCGLAIFIVLLVSTDSNGQDSYNFVQFFYNKSLINPSLTGIDGQPAAFLSFKKQWIGITGAPSVGQFSVQVPTLKRLSFGINLNNDKRGVLGTSSLLFSTSYNLPLNKNLFFRFGFSLGAGWNRTDINALVFSAPGTDKVLSDILNNSIQPLGNAGFSIHSKTFHMGVSVPNLFQPAYLAKDPFSITKIAPFESVIFHSSYRYYFSNDRNVFEPFLNYRLNSSLPSQIEAAGILHLQNKIWFGGSYKQDFGISGIIGFNLNKLASIGYAYTVKNIGINQLGRPSQEIQIGFLFGSHHKGNPVYSMIKTEKERRRVAIAQKNNPPSKSKSVANAAPLKPKPVGKGVIVNSGQNIKPSVNQAPQAVAVVKSEPKPAQPVKQDSAARIPPVPEPIKPVAADPSAMPDQEMLRRAASGDTVGIYVEERTKLDAFLAENAFGTHDDPHEFLLNTREETRNRTRAPDELESATHVITGAFISKANAEHFTSELRKLGFNANFGQLSQLKIWYVFIAKETDLVKARAERDEFRKNKIFRNAWVLTVQ